MFLLAETAFSFGEVQSQQHHGYNHIQPVQVELGHIGFCGLFIGVIVHKSKLIEIGDLG